jgi:hypothetical protein
MPILKRITIVIGVISSMIPIVIYFSGVSNFLGLFGKTDQTPIYYVANTRPPDDFLALRSEPSGSAGYRMFKMPNGTRLEVLSHARSDGWWRVRMVDTGLEGWAMSGGDRQMWIVCCVRNHHAR